MQTSTNSLKSLKDGIQTTEPYLGLAIYHWNRNKEDYWYVSLDYLPVKIEDKD